MVRIEEQDRKMASCWDEAHQVVLQLVLDVHVFHLGRRHVGGHRRDHPVHHAALVLHIGVNEYWPPSTDHKVLTTKY